MLLGFGYIFKFLMFYFFFFFKKQKIIDKKSQLAKTLSKGHISLKFLSFKITTLTLARNQEFFRAGEVSENKGTSIKI